MLDWPTVGVIFVLQFELVYFDVLIPFHAMKPETLEQSVELASMAGIVHRMFVVVLDFELFVLGRQLCRS